MPEITLVHGLGSEKATEMQAYLAKLIPQALSTPFHKLKEGDITVGILNSQHTPNDVDIEIRVAAMWDIARWFSRKKRVTMIRDYFEVFLTQLNFLRSSYQGRNLKVSVSLSLSLSAYVGTGYKPDGFHVRQVPVTDWEEIGDGEQVQRFAFPPALLPANMGARTS